MKNIKLAFFGTPTYSLLVLRELYKSDYPISIVVTKPDRPVGRKQILTATAVALWAKEHQLPLFQPEADPTRPWLFKDDPEVTESLVKYDPDILITADYTQKIPQSLVKQIKYGGLNVHPSLLPAYRGPAPAPWAILRGETETGVSIVTLAEEFDTGRVIAQEKEPILATDTTNSLMTKLFTKGGELLVKILSSYISDPTYRLQPTTYNLQPTYFPRFTRNDGFIPWSILAAAIKNLTFPESAIPDWPIAKYFDKQFIIHNSKFIIYNSFRALHPWPGVWTKVKLRVQRSKFEEKRLKLIKLHLLQPITYNLQPILVLDQIQLEGKKPSTDLKDFI